ncbi:C1 family peptidase [Algoriphagus sp.]|uniref:C1 family peptidase n=1 Tax=Algoriphagus sp. TaxID=1872435 RepID=UPI002728763E|nr:C1 family peptidase [Algoriphagus sp.]MDO8968198.1 C1 family peptidase [Algoriphagus sp.]MDP3198691.1 C1 family peptidase [Algoriphagus sp.]
MRKILFLPVFFFLLSGCLEKNEFAALLSTDPLSQTGEVFISEDGEEYWMGCENSYCYGFTGAAPEGDQTLQNLTIPNNLPASFDLSTFLPQIGNQGRLGSCTAWATAYYGRSLLYNFSENSSRAQKVQLSPSYIYNQLTQGQCKGTSISKSLQLLVDQGTSEWDVFPYQANGCNLQPTVNQRANAGNFKMGDYKILRGIDLVAEVKTLLTRGNPVVVAMGLDQEFGKKDSFGLSAYRPHQVKKSEIYGSHAMLVVGYSDQFKAFKLVNSWGDGWGDSGFVWVDYEAFDNVFDLNNPFRVLCQAFVGLN